MTASSRFRTTAFAGIFLLVALTAVFAGACDFSRHGPGEAEERPELILRVYDVPKEYGAEISSIIRRLLQPQGSDKPGSGSASLAPGGKLLVAAPGSIHAGVSELVTALSAKKPEPPPSVAVNVWVVAGRSNDQQVNAPELAAIAPAVEAIAKTTGPMQLELVERLSLTSFSGDRAKVSGALVELSENASVYEDKVIVDLKIDPQGPAEYETRVQIDSGKLLVLGQAGYVPAAPGMPFFAERDKVKNPTLFYVVRAEALAR